VHNTRLYMFRDRMSKPALLPKEKALALGGICERSERLIIIILGLAAGLLYSMEFFVYSLILVSLLSLITIVQRFVNVVRSA